MGVFCNKSLELPGRKMAVERFFDWEGQSWRLLSLYVCEDCLVGDFCVRVEPEVEDAFLRKWMPLIESGLTQAQEEQLRLENPFTLDVRVFARINGEECRNFHGAQELWNPSLLIGEGRERDARRWLDHYGRDPELGWIFLRTHWRHDWQGRDLESLELLLREDDVRIQGPCFEAKAGDRITFTRPATGTGHTLIVEEGPTAYTMEPGEYGGMVMPGRYRMMTYRVEPELPQGVLSVRDSCGGDPPRSGESAACIGIIGSADGPTAIFFTSPGEPKKNAAVSSLYFELPEKTVWRMQFREAARPEKRVVIR